MAVNKWTRNKEIYCKIPFQRSSKNHPDVIKIANLIEKTPSAVNMKIGNFGSFDDTLKKQGLLDLQMQASLIKKFGTNLMVNGTNLLLQAKS